jgi:hypothetical protein
MLAEHWGREVGGSWFRNADQLPSFDLRSLAFRFLGNVC